MARSISASMPASFHGSSKLNDVVTREQIHQQANRIPGASQATNIEQSRAIAEVQAMVLVAQRAPRDEARAMNHAIQSCGQRAVADRAFFSFSRGGGNVNGSSIQLATELARCWGNIDYGIMELARDDNAGHTEMLAFAWDLETNTKSRQTFIVPHTRDTRQGKKALTDNRDIYENNANNGARRLRECIFRVLPPYLKAAAEAKCREVLEKGEGDEPLPARIAKAIDRFSRIGVSIDRIEDRHGPSTSWTPVDLANLQITFQSIRQGETTADEAFPKPGTADVTEDLKKLAKGKTKAQPDDKADDQPADRGVDAGVDTTTPDNPTAQEGRSDEDHGDQHDGTDESPAWRAAVDQHLADVAAAGTVIDLKSAINRFEKHREFLSAEALAEVNAAEKDAADRLNPLRGG
jgi:hypothetical protein